MVVPWAGPLRTHHSPGVKEKLGFASTVTLAAPVMLCLVSAPSAAARSSVEYKSTQSVCKSRNMFFGLDTSSLESHFSSVCNGVCDGNEVVCKLGFGTGNFPLDDCVGTESVLGICGGR